MNKSNTSEKRNQLHKYLYKRKNSQIPISLLAKVLLICMFLSMQNVLGLLSEEDMNTVIRVLNAGKNNLKPKLDGPLSPIMLYAYRKTNIVEKDLFYFQYLLNGSVKMLRRLKEYSLGEIDPIDSPFKGGKDVCRNKTKKKIANHYSALINMFPSPAGKASIYPKEGCKDSFTSFLKSDPVKEYAHTILAILFLRAEGVPVPLIIEDEESACPRLTWTDEFNPAESFSVPIDIASAEGQESSDSDEEANIKKSSIKIVQTIKYFLNAESCQELEESIVLLESTEKEVYWENEFAKTPAWLIQSYIYYYLETKENVIEFCRLIVQTGVFFVTESMITDNYNTSMEVFSKLVTCKDTQTDALKQWEKVKKLEDVVESVKRNRLLPFRDNSQLPTITAVEADAQGNTESDEELISSDIESVLLTLLCCFAYNPETNTYNFDKIPRAQEEVKNLFAMPSKNASTSSDSSETSGNPDINNPASNNAPVIQAGQKIPQEVQKKWFEIIQNLVKGDEDISYITMGGRRM
ncbi:hypothetical protein NEAUS05_2583, partial [Nematocida ausubeli]